MARDYGNFDDVLERMRERKAELDAKNRAQDETDAYVEHEGRELEGGR